MKDPRILIIDYSTDRSEADLFRRCLPRAAEITVVFMFGRDGIPEAIKQEHFTHIIHSGSALSITEPAPFTADVVDFILSSQESGVAQMGICYGHQLLNLAFVGPQAVRRSPNGLEIGWGEVSFRAAGQDLLGVSSTERVWQSHFDEVIEVPKESILLASNEHTQIQGFFHDSLRLFGTQFHPEFDRDTGNAQFLKDKGIISDHGYDLSRILERSPSFNTNTLFRFFLERFRDSGSHHCLG